ncbi:adenylyl-sulfate kinase [Pseudodesulfovibrio tunisiensis]|uniref:adenylyl-sulfate kinase n=1 Tax=Pseudodesulfovibrio tunisiensis TaxID=463192 RepID=UPI001FB5621E|nr:adenylyl-sulfate kinase [Pseudodesulfovibrio tunisiensis]
MTPKYICKYRGAISRQDRENRNHHKAVTLWFTGLSCSGKSTIAHAVEKQLFDLGRQVYVFDGDNVRHGLCRDLTFSPEDRNENLRRIAEMTKLFMDAGIICLCAFITPRESDRQMLRSMHADGDFHLVHVDCPVEECSARDVKGYYALARQGKIRNYTGISAPFDTPQNPELTLDSRNTDLRTCVDQVMHYLTPIIG